MELQAPSRAIADRFWRRVRRVEGDGCWLWTGKPYGFGYGRASVGARRTVAAHRLAYVIAHGPLTAEACVLHRCDTPLGVRPDHLFVGSRGDNARDMAAKGRSHLQRRPDAFAGDKHWKRRRPELVLRGSAHPNARVTEAIVLDIRARVARGETRRSLATALNLTESTVGRIAQGVIWAHVGGPLTPAGPSGRRRGHSGATHAA